MRILKQIIYIALILLLIGCTTENAKEDDQDINITELSTNQSTEQHIAKEAMELLKKNDEITSIEAVNTKKDLIVAFEVHHIERFQLTKLRKKFKEKLKKQFPNMNIEISTDKKIIIELNKLENKLRKNELSEEKLIKDIKHIKKLMKEQT